MQDCSEHPESQGTPFSFSLPLSAPWMWHGAIAKGSGVQTEVDDGSGREGTMSIAYEEETALKALGHSSS